MRCRYACRKYNSIEMWWKIFVAATSKQQHEYCNNTVIVMSNANGVTH